MCRCLKTFFLLVGIWTRTNFIGVRECPFNLSPSQIFSAWKSSKFTSHFTILSYWSCRVRLYFCYTFQVKTFCFSCKIANKLRYLPVTIRHPPHKNVIVVTLALYSEINSIKYSSIRASLIFGNWLERWMMIYGRFTRNTKFVRHSYGKLLNIVAFKKTISS